MGVNNRQRRAAKRRKRDRGRSGAAGQTGSGYGWGGSAEDRAREQAALIVPGIVAQVVADRAGAGRYAAELTDPGAPVAPRFVAEAVAEMLAGLVIGVVRGGWTPCDLAEIVTRRLNARHVPLLACLVAAETGRHPAARVDPAWRDDLDRLGPWEPPDLTEQPGLELGLGLCAVLIELPVVARLMAPPGAYNGAGTGPTGTDTRVLAKVRSLLAKAESTQFPEEAEALSGKAQELMSRHSLDRLLHEARQQPEGNPVTARRLWINPPYVLPKAMLVHAVATANRCRSVVSEALGFASLIGEAPDLEAVELLVTSLLVQADRAMLRYGRQSDRRGQSRTTSFRRSFLLAYAERIGERLRASTSGAVEDTGRRGELVPVLARQAERVDAATARLFPNAFEREARISNGYGWAAGLAAADLALLDSTLEVTEAAS